MKWSYTDRDCYNCRGEARLVLHESLYYNRSEFQGLLTTTNTGTSECSCYQYLLAACLAISII